MGSQSSSLKAKLARKSSKINTLLSPTADSITTNRVTPLNLDKITLIQTCALLSLPREIRDIIYIMALQSHTGYFYALGTLTQTRGKRTAPFTFTPIHPAILHEPISPDRIPALALLQTCSQVRAEATPVFYAVNTFSISPLTPNIMSRKLTESLRHIRITGYIGIVDPLVAEVSLRCLKEEMGILRGMPGLETVTLRILSNRREMVTFHEGVKNVIVAKFFGLLREDRLGWLALQNRETLLAQEAPVRDPGMRTRKIRRRLEVASIDENDILKWGPRLKMLFDAFGGEVWFWKKTWDNDLKEFVESSVRAELASLAT